MSTRIGSCLLTSTAITIMGPGCGGTREGPGEGDVGAVGSVQQPERWAADDDPSLFAEGLERRASALPDSGDAATVPWAGSYWPVTDDSVNHRWGGPDTDSPAKKYEAAFGLTGVEDAVSSEHGIDAHADAKACTTDDECDADTVEVCAKRAGAASGRCIPTWFGICHAWAPAAILVPEPQHEVVENGVTFEVQDIKALISLVHDRTESRSVSLRCDARDARDEITYDASGRASSDCRDTNAGTFHVVLTNYLGLRKQSFIEDRTFDHEVWNHPIRGYTVLSKETVTAEEANQLIGAPPGDYLFNDDARSWIHVTNEVAYIEESDSSTDGNLASIIDEYTGHDTYEYILELDEDGVIIGGEWVGASKRNHPDFLWLPTGVGSTSVAGGKIRHAEVMALAAASIQPSPLAGPTP